jgi:hypothetical protein
LAAGESPAQPGRNASTSRFSMSATTSAGAPAAKRPHAAGKFAWKGRKPWRVSTVCCGRAMYFRRRDLVPLDGSVSSPGAPPASPPGSAGGDGGSGLAQGVGHAGVAQLLSRDSHAPTRDQCVGGTSTMWMKRPRPAAGVREPELHRPHQGYRHQASVRQDLRAAVMAITPQFLQRVPARGLQTDPRC